MSLSVTKLVHAYSSKTPKLTVQLRVISGVNTSRASAVAASGTAPDTFPQAGNEHAAAHTMAAMAMRRLADQVLITIVNTQQQPCRVGCALA